MATVIPTGWEQMQSTGAAQRELETLRELASGLPEGFTVYHGVHWTRIERGFSAFGEVDFAVVSPSGRLLVIEQKTGLLDETPEGLQKDYGRGPKSVPAQIDRSVQALMQRYGRGQGNPALKVDYLLYCPDYRVRNVALAGIDPSRVVDASRREMLCLVIQGILPSEDPLPQLASVHRFLANELDLVPEIGALAGAAGRLYTRISGGLATWARRLEFEPFRLRVIGTAGSGKTQLALQALKDASVAGRKSAYVCFNRPLADHMLQMAPSGVEVGTYHQFCDRRARAAGDKPDFRSPGIFRELERRFAELPVPEESLVDELIVDEGQDFDPAWAQPLLRLLKPGGRAWWLEDPLQNLYGRATAELPGWTVLRSDTNYRSPRDILRDLTGLIALPHVPEAGSPLEGSGMEISTYGTQAALIEETKAVIGKAMAAGFKKDMIAVITFRGRESSSLTPYDRLGPYRLRSFTGNYDLLGHPEYCEGDVLLESVYRFKGQSAPAVILTEVDFEDLDEISMRKIFVGATRATMKVYAVMSERAVKRLLEGRSASG